MALPLPPAQYGDYRRKTDQGHGDADKVRDVRPGRFETIKLEIENGVQLFHMARERAYGGKLDYARKHLPQQQEGNLHQHFHVPMPYEWRNRNSQASEQSRQRCHQQSDDDNTQHLVEPIYRVNPSIR